MLKYINCAICASNSYRSINTCKITEEDAKIKEEALTIVKCNVCGLIFVNPQPEFSKEELAILYNKEYFDKGYMEFNELFAFRLDCIEKYRKPGKILDIGSAGGEFLNLARDRGWEGCGVEVSDYAAELAIKKYNLRVSHGILEEARYQDNYFDAACAADILEHLDKPQNALGEIWRILNKAGLLYLSFPNAASCYYNFFTFICRFTNRNYFLLPYHLYHFSPSSIKLLLDKSGFDTLELIYSRSKSKLYFMNIFNFHDRIVVIARKRT
jgi:SAM-dependent methyltransferase